MKYDTNNHSVFLLQYHLVMCVKYRRKVIDDEISEQLKALFERIAEPYNITLDEWNHDKDHVHVLFRGQPNSALSKFINAYKSASSRLIKRDYPSLRQQLWKEMFWSRSFFLISTGGASYEQIKQYIQSQGEDKPCDSLPVNPTKPSNTKSTRRRRRRRSSPGRSAAAGKSGT